MFKEKVIVCLLIFSSFAVFGQSGIIRGSVIDETSAEPLFGVTVVIQGTTTGAVTDFDGKFEIKANPGTYNLEISYVSYSRLTINDVLVKESDVTILNDIRMIEDIAQLAEVVVTATAIRTTEEALLTVKRRSANVLDGISAANFRKIGDSDAASAMKRITGVSLEGGKYVYVRGLGDRYTKTTLNGVDMPGLDPDKNTIQMDIFPTNVIDNIIVAKSYTAELGADFTGGAVNIETQDFPELKILKVKGGIGYNPSMHFNNNYVTYSGGKTDFLGFDDGSREIPTSRRTDIPQFAEVVGSPNSEKGQDYQNILRSFNPTLGAMRAQSFLNYNLGLSTGNQFSREKVTIGYNVSLTYKNETEFYEGAEFNLYAKAAQPNQTELIPIERQIGDFGVNNVLIGGLAGLAFKTSQSKYKVNLLHLQNGESKAGLFNFNNTNLGANFEANQYNIEYSERALTNILINGTHFSPDRRWNIDWKISPTRSSIEDPDVRFTRIRVPELTVSTEAGLPERIWRFMEEISVSGKADATREYTFNDQNAKLRFGTSHTYKQRDFNIQNFQFSVGDIQITDDPNDIFKEENLFSSERLNGVRYNPMFIPNNPNNYTANAMNSSGYVSNEFSPFEKFKAVLGVRFEKYVQHYTGTNQTGSISLNNEKVLNDFDFFPSVNFIYSLNDLQNLRISYSRTIARPSLKELSYAEILDPITGRTFIGGLAPEVTNQGTEVLWDGNLVSTNIDNLDVRWEIFQTRGQMISISGYYKKFQNPIETVQFLSDAGSFQPRNVGDATVVGVEIEMRKSLGFLSHGLDNFSFSSNVTITDSKIDMSGSELRSRQLSAREGEVVKNTRPMAGQAPYIINSGFAYVGLNNGLEAGLYYNVQGETLFLVGFSNRTDVFSVPFHSLNFNLNKTLGVNEQMRVGMKFTNILNDSQEKIFKNYKASEQYFTRLNPGSVFSLSFDYTF